MAKKLKPLHPGEVLREEFLVPLKLSAGALAKACGLPRTRIERIASEQSGITADTALRLAKALGTTVQLWRQLLADVLQRPLYTSAISSASARGAALLAGVASGVFSSCQDTLRFSPVPELVAEPQGNLEERYQKFKALYPRIN